MGWSAAQQLGRTIHRPHLSYKGYTLIAPLGGDSVFLLDMDGRFVRRWSFGDLRPSKVELLENGNLLAMGVDVALLPTGPPPEVGSPFEPFDKRIRRLGGNCSTLREVTWDGDVVWEHTDIAAHHDFMRRPNGNTIFPVWVEMTPELTKAVRGGHRFRREQLGPMLGDDVFEVTRRGEIVWEWLNPVFNPRADGTPSCWLFRAHRYPPDHPALAGRGLDPDALSDLNRLYGLV